MESAFLDLPVDIFHLIFPLLDATDFLNLTSTCKQLHQPEFVNDAPYWSKLIRKTFRVPNQPVAQHDGERWKKLYKRMYTQTRVFSWGSNDNCRLGQSWNAVESIAMPGRPTRTLHVAQERCVSWPGEMTGMDQVGVVADVQAGGWSTVLLSSKGALYIVGVLNGLGQNMFRCRPSAVPTPLEYPPGLPPPHERYDSSTAIASFSVGRAHVLGISDSGRIWCWGNNGESALRVQFAQHDLVESSGHGLNTVQKVVAGWDMSAALIVGTGIVIWRPATRSQDLTAMEDTAIVQDAVVVPGTSYSSAHSVNKDLAGAVGEVRNFIVLEHYILFNTSIGKIFVWNHITQDMPRPVELVWEQDEFATDVQGSFRSFAVFTRSDGVLTSTQDRLEQYLQPLELDERPTLFARIPALQNKNVISLAFGDHHFHALHSQGYITSYGHEPQSCGALGLGGGRQPDGRLRGIRYQNVLGDGRLVPHAYTEGRRVWFEKEKRAWIWYLTSGASDPEESQERMRMTLGTQDTTAQGEVSEWVEQQGRDWGEKLGVANDQDDGMDAYFVLGVTAAGWHSAALVLVNEEWAARQGYKYIWAANGDKFPRLILSDGTEMPGSGPFDTWRYDRPEFKLDLQSLGLGS
ncbi:RCC1/BLIP-II [Piedraia hortae CBS 480.64]|uniref:RCC1/BLIP-II n=1 Tax=Piedraia hortae CBS 480.64 TaxID=1314780 RepID=A0A6A7C6W4_9PEZI|nr:RCC1/BLIP-II [Piedraia hortae CBS 480.64]